MTTVLYDHKRKKIAVDGRISDDYTVISDSFQKWRITEHGVLFFCGVVSDFERIVEALDWYSNGDEVESGSPIECTVFRVSGGLVERIYVCEDGVLRVMRCDFNDSIGSGGDWAIAALDQGRSIVKSMEYAASKDLATGGKISVMDVRTGAFE